MTANLETWFERMPAVAILRGVKPEEAVAIGEALYNAGIGIIEVPLNSPQPLDSIEQLSKALGDRCIIGAGTVLCEQDAEDVAAAGGTIAVTPNTSTEVIHRSLELGMTPMPGWASATEAFSAYRAGARYLKLFPAATYGPGHIKAVRAILPSDVKLLAVGGVSADVAAEWLHAGVDGFGIGSELYRPGAGAYQVFISAKAVVHAIRAVLDGQE